MPNKKISQLNSVEQLFGDEKLLITQGAANKTSTVPVLGTKLNSDVGAAVSGLNSQSTAFAANARASITGIGSDLAASIGALHRSPNAITSMFVYDTSKDSDGGAWTEKCQHTSWYNETVYGKWLGAVVNELQGRYQGATVASELLTNSNFSNGTTGWRSEWSSTISATNGILAVTGSQYGKAVQSITVEAGAVYRVVFTGYHSTTGGNIKISNVGSDNSELVGIGLTKDPSTYTQYFVSTGTTLYVTLQTDSATNISYSSYFSIKKVTALNTASGDYFQLTTDGKFYRLWKNRIRGSSDFSNANDWGVTGVALTSPTTVPVGVPSRAKLLTETTANAQHRISQGSTVAAGMGGQVFTWSVKYKPNGRNRFYLWTQIPNTGAIFDAQALTAQASPNGGITASIVAVGDGAVQASITFTTDPTYPSNNSVWFVLSNGSADSNPSFGSSVATYTGDGVSGGYVWDCQLEQGTVVTAIEEKASTVGSISEVYRGNKREFPKLSAIVAEASNVTIYDLTEPGRPMWMRYLISTPNTAIYGGAAGSVYCSNSMITVGGNNVGLYVGNFVSDSQYRYSTNNNATRYLGSGIADRNTKGWTSGSMPYIANAVVNAVAMTVLPDAPVDPVTGLQVPTIAVGTNGGLSLIRHNGTVYNITSFPSAVNFLSISGKTLYISGTFGSQSNFGFIKDIGAANPVNYYVSSGYDCAAYLAYNGYGGVRNTAAKGVVAVAAPVAYTGAPYALAFQKTNFSFPDGTGNKAAQGAFARLTSSWNMGYSVGDLRRVYLSDVDIGIAGPSTELVVNGNFSNGTTGWSAADATLSASNNQITVTATSTTSNACWAYQPFYTVAGVTYLINFRFVGKSASNAAYFRITTSVPPSGQIVDISQSSLVAGTTYQVTFTGTGGLLYVGLGTYGSIGGYSTFSDVSIDSVFVRDRSYKSKNANIAGILTKSPVATNAQLVGYSGFSAANYLREPYSADLDFGTGEWSASAWVNIPTSFPTENPVSLTNGTFDNSLTGWTVANGAIWDASQRALLPNINASISQTISTIPGKTYKVTFTRQGWEPALLIVDGVQYSIGSTTSSAVTASQTFVAINANTSLQIKPSGSTPTYIDNVIPVQLIDNTILSREYSSGASVKIGVTAVGTITATAYDGTTTRTVTSPNAYNTGTWNKVRVNYTTDGKLALLVNGVEVASATGTALLTLNNSNAVLTIGNNYAANAPFPGSLALVKFSATVPTTEQSQWMYEQEKAMFQPGAQVCLPSSNSVTDLTYDNLTDTWIAAQSTHISEWKGLVRTSYRKPASGSFDKLSAASGVRLMTRSSWGVDIEAQPVQLKKELFSSTDASINNQNTTTFDFDSTSTQTDFVLPVGYTAQAVFSAGVQIFEGSTGNKFTRLFDGFKETIRFATAPGNGVWVKIRAVRAQG